MCSLQVLSWIEQEPAGGLHGNGLCLFGILSLSPSLFFFLPFGWAVMGFKGKYLIHYWQNLPGWAHLILTTTSCMERLQVFSVIVAGVIFTRVRE
jgi:hypothetical protein